MDNRIAYGLAKREGIGTKGMTPKEVWEALDNNGIKSGRSGYDSKEKFPTVKKEIEKVSPKKELKVKEMQALYDRIKSGKKNNSCRNPCGQRVARSGKKNILFRVKNLLPI